MTDLKKIKAVTFDCYGTLIDWETGILGALKPLLAQHGVTASDAEILGRYAAFEAEFERGGYISYRMVLQNVLRKFGEHYRFVPRELMLLERALPAWPPFGDTVEALKTLKRRFRLAIISNIDDDLFEGTARQLGVKFDEVVTARQVGSYKPSQRNFQTAITRLALPPWQILHAAQSLYHDAVPAKACGMVSVWVNRQSGRDGGGATPPAPDAKPDFEVPDMKSLAGLLK